jgi:hypothetical protein
MTLESVSTKKDCDCFKNGNRQITLKMSAFWGKTPCSLEVDGRFRGAYCHHYQVDNGRNVSAIFL